MLTVAKKNRSLTFYNLSSKRNISEKKYTPFFNLIPTLNTNVAVSSLNCTRSFNKQLDEKLTYLINKEDKITQRLQVKLKENPQFKGYRRKGVELALEYEKADVEMGGKGSANWSREERKQLIKDGKVSGVEGHHSNNVANYVEEQADPNNIKFYKDRETHKNEGHKGNFKNPSTGEKIDRKNMLRKTNLKRIFKNEVQGLSFTIAIALGVGFTINFIINVAQSGIRNDNVKEIVSNSSNGLGEIGIVAGINYIIGRTMGETLQNAIINYIKMSGGNISENVIKMCDMMSIGILTTSVFFIYSFMKLKKKGMETKKALLSSGKQASISLSILLVSLIVQKMYGGLTGILVGACLGIGLTICYLTYEVFDIKKNKELYEKIYILIVQGHKPILI